VKKEYSELDFKEHLEKEHKLSTLSTHIREIVYGGTDGIITTFAVVAGFSGAQAITSDSTLPILTVLLFGFANLFADGASMGLGNFLSVRADQDLYKREKDKERKEIKENTDMEKAETTHILMSRGFTQGEAAKMAEIYARNEGPWVDFMMREELGMPSPESENPFLTGLITFLAFILFGFIPLTPYVFTQNILSSHSFSYSILFTFVALLILGISRWKVTRQSISRSVGETVLLGSISAIIAYFVGTMFRQ